MLLIYRNQKKLETNIILAGQDLENTNMITENGYTNI